MANLKGSSFDKQVKDMHHRLSAFGQGRHGNNDHQTHSSALSEKRMEYARSFADYAERNGFEGKLNDYMTNDNVRSFLEERTADLSASTSENYVRGFSSMIEGLKESNVDIVADRSVFDHLVSDIREHAPEHEIETGRSIENVDQVIGSLYQDRYESGVLADIQHDLGLRVSEAHELASNLHDYYNPDNGTIAGLIGKGNHEYEPKDISADLVAKIEAIENLPSIRTYQDDLAGYDLSSHDFRFTYAEELFNSLIDQGVSYHDALKEVSEELNHSREEMTLYYLNRA